MKGTRLEILSFVIVIGFVAAIFVGLGYEFFTIWHQDQGKAQTFGAFLAFVASSISAVFTLVYVFLTRESLREAHRANENLLQQWKQKVTVTPKFWLSCGDMVPHELPRVNSERLWKCAEYTAVNGTIWNYSEQSVLIHSVEVQICYGTQARKFTLDIDKVIRPHKTRTVQLAHLIFVELANVGAALPSDLAESIPKEEVSLNIRYLYTDWESTNKWSQFNSAKAVVTTNWGAPAIRAMKINIELQEPVQCP